MTSLLCNWFDDWGRAISRGLGTTGLIIMIILTAAIAIGLIWGITRRGLGIYVFKSYFSWAMIFLFVIDVLFLIWFITLI